MVLCRKDEGISVWRIRRLPGGRKKSVVVDGKGGEGTGKPWDMILDMKFNLVTHLQSSAISPDGGWVAISDAREVKLFRLISEVRSPLIWSVLGRGWGLNALLLRFALGVGDWYY